LEKVVKRAAVVPILELSITDELDAPAQQSDSKHDTKFDDHNLGDGPSPSLAFGLLITAGPVAP
jgi:hypothetical protein